MKKPIAFLSLSLITLALLSSACHKSNAPHPTPAPEPYGVSAVINGTPTTFNAIITVDSATTPGTVYITAHADSANLNPLLEITLSNSGPLKAGTYYYSDTAGGPSGQLGYTSWMGGTYFQYNSTSDTVNLLAVNNTWLSGTFSGTCVYSTDTTVSVENGQFTVNWNQQ